MNTREVELNEAAKNVASAMNDPEEIRRGLASITAESLYSSELAKVMRRAYDVPQEALDRVIYFEPRH